VTAKYTKDEYEYMNLKYRINMRPHVKFEDHWNKLKVDERYFFIAVEHE